MSGPDDDETPKLGEDSLPMLANRRRSELSDDALASSPFAFWL